VTLRRRLIGISIAWLILSPRIANAGIIEWIDQLSGPGSFLGFVIEGRLHCFPIARNDDAYVEGKARSPESAREQALSEDYKNKLGVILACPNRLKEGERAWITVNLGAGMSWALHNDLPYAPGKDNGVKFVTLEPSVWWYPLPPVAIGAGFGNYWFSGPAFDTFSRFYFKPVQVELKPFAFPKHRWHTKAEIFTIRVGYTLIPEGFTAADFGAIGPFKTEHEALPNVSVLLDLGSVKGFRWFH
jgi:hypothetical protein